MRTVIFVCTGNTCRSPMAEAIARQWIKQGELGDPQQIFVASAGIAATDGRPVAGEAVVALSRMNIEHEGSTKRLTAEMIRKAEAVLCMTEKHAQMARELVSGETDHEAKVVMLDPGKDVEDPIGFGQPAYDELAQKFQKVIPRRLKELLGETQATRGKQ